MLSAWMTQMSLWPAAQPTPLVSCACSNLICARARQQQTQKQDKFRTIEQQRWLLHCLDELFAETPQRLGSCLAIQHTGNRTHSRLGSMSIALHNPQPSIIVNHCDSQ